MWWWRLNWVFCLEGKCLNPVLLPLQLKMIF